MTAQAVLTQLAIPVALLALSQAGCENAALTEDCPERAKTPTACAEAVNCIQHCPDNIAECPAECLELDAAGTQADTTCHVNRLRSCGKAAACDVNDFACHAERCPAEAVLCGTTVAAVRTCPWTEETACIGEDVGWCCDGDPGELDDLLGCIADCVDCAHPDGGGPGGGSGGGGGPSCCSEGCSRISVVIGADCDRAMRELDRCTSQADGVPMWHLDQAAGVCCTEMLETF